MRKVVLSMFSAAFIFSGSDAMNQPAGGACHQNNIVKYIVATTPRDAVFIQSEGRLLFEGVSTTELFFGQGSNVNGFIFQKPLTLRANMSKTEIAEILTAYYNAKVTVTEN